MDWSNERYVRVYVRDTTTWKLLGWEGQTVLMHLIRKLDRAGRLDVEGCTAEEAVQLHTGLPEDVVSKGWDAVTKRDVFVTDESGILMPNYLEAQEAAQSDAQRQREFRARKRDVTKRDAIESQNVTKPLQPVTSSHVESQPVTPSVPSVPNRAVPNARAPEAPLAIAADLIAEVTGQLWDAGAWADDLRWIASKPEAERAAVAAGLAADEWVFGNPGKVHPGHVRKFWARYLAGPSASEHHRSYHDPLVLPDE